MYFLNLMNVSMHAVPNSNIVRCCKAVYISSHTMPVILRLAKYYAIK